MYKLLLIRLLKGGCLNLEIIREGRRQRSWIGRKKFINTIERRLIRCHVDTQKPFIEKQYSAWKRKVEPHAAKALMLEVHGIGSSHGQNKNSRICCATAVMIPKSQEAVTFMIVNSFA